MIHEPDPDTPLDETLGALDDLVRAGQGRCTSARATSKRGGLRAA